MKVAAAERLGGGAVRFERRPDGRGVVETVQREHARQATALDGRDRAAAGRDEQVAVGLLDGLAVAWLDGDALGVGVDRRHLVFAAQVDAPVFDLVGRQREEVGEFFDLAVGGLAFQFTRCAQPGGVTADYDEGIHTHVWMPRHVGVR